MTLTIDIPRELEGRLQEEAAKRGVAAEELARTFLEERLLSPAEGRLWERSGEWEKAFDEWIAGQDPGRPPLPEEAARRESFYGDRG
jgi:predicted transcriptional regulator